MFILYHSLFEYQILRYTQKNCRKLFFDRLFGELFMVVVVVVEKEVGLNPQYREIEVLMKKILVK
jgi:hypothetical protein